MQLPAKDRISFFTIPSVILFLVLVMAGTGLFRQNRVIVDAPSFYAYLPAVFVYHDIHLNFVDKDKEFFKDKIWYYRIEEGRKLIKHPAGFSVVMSPFFLLAHVYTKATDGKADGFSMPYQNFMSAGVLIYLTLGLYWLRKLLLRWFKDKTVAITLAALVLATNLFYYSTIEGLMTHAVTFSFLSGCLYYYFRWIEEKEQRPLLYFFLLFAFVVLIRPLAITISLFFIIHALIRFRWKAFIDLLIRFRKPLFSGILFILCAGSIQLIYWKVATGKWVYDVYKNEPFLFADPEMFNFLFSFRKGLFIYSPVLLLMIPGLILLYKWKKDLFWSILVLFISSVYLISSWWAWSYGISWGVRPLIDYYCFFSIPLAFCIEQFSGRFAKVILMTFITCCIALNLFQTWQYKNELIHYDDMSREAYFKGFFQTHQSNEWKDALKPYNWRRRVEGKEQIRYSLGQFESLKTTDTVYIRGAEQLYLSASAKADFILACYFNEVTSDEQFFIHHLAGDTIALRTRSGRFLSWKPDIHDLVVANSPVISSSEKFIYEYVPGTDNQFHIKAANGKYLSPEVKFPHIVRAVANTAGYRESFRVFVMEDYRKDF